MPYNPPTEESTMPVHYGRVVYGMEEVREAIGNAQEFLHHLPKELDSIIDNQERLEMGEFTRRYGLLVISIRAMVSHLSEAEEFVMGSLEEEKKQLTSKHG
jgi:hypothetical protein